MELILPQPSIDAILITFRGVSGEAPTRRKGRNAWIMKKMVFIFRSCHGVPGFLRNILDLPATIADAGVVDQNIERLLPFPVGLGQLLDAGD